MEKEIKNYLNAVKRRLNLPRDIRRRCISDLQTTIQARIENGESWEAVRSSLGTPKDVAAELSEQLKEFVYRKSPWRFLFLAAAVLSGGWLVFYAGMQMVLRIIAGQAASLGIIGGADGPTAIFYHHRHSHGLGCISHRRCMRAGHCRLPAFAQMQAEAIIFSFKSRPKAGILLFWHI